MFRIAVLSFWVALSVSCSVSGTPSSGQGQFAQFFNYQSNEDLPYCSRKGLGRCILGTVKAGQPIQLLSSNSSQTCLARAIKSFPFESDSPSDSFPLTQIDLSLCPNFDFELAVLGDNQLNYMRLEKLPMPSASVAREVDTRIRRDAGGVKPSSAEHQFALAPTTPELFRLPAMGSDQYVAVYQNAMTPGDQVHFLYSNGKVKLIHSAATIASVFSLNGKSFIHYSFTCRVGCGWGGEIVFEFSKDSFEMVMFDDSTST